MYSTIEKEKVTRGPATMRHAVTRTEARRDGIAAMGGTLLAALRRRFRRAAIARHLMALDDRLLADIGIERWQIAEVADWAASEASAEPAGNSPWRAVGRFLSVHVVAPVARAHRRRVAYRELSALDDRLLTDIGLTRGEIPAVVQALVERDLRRDGPVYVAAQEEHDMLRSLRLWNRSRWAAKALHALDDRMLNDIGLVRGDVDELAEEMALRSLKRPANRNLASEAA